MRDLPPGHVEIDPDEISFTKRFYDILLLSFLASTEAACVGVGVVQVRVDIVTQRLLSHAGVCEEAVAIHTPAVLAETCSDRGNRERIRLQLRCIEASIDKRNV